MSKHTPGPWKASTQPQPNGCPIIGARGLMVAMLAHSVNEPDQKETALANAALIAAAPQLLAALRGMVDSYEREGHRSKNPALIAARAAIAKAEGRT